MFYSDGSSTSSYQQHGDHTNSHDIPQSPETDTFVGSALTHSRNVGDPMPAAKTPDPTTTTRDARRLSTLLEISQALSGTLNLKSSMPVSYTHLTLPTS